MTTDTHDPSSPPTPQSTRLEELGRIIMAYSEVTEKLQESHDLLKGKVDELQRELSDKNRQLERRNRLEALGEMAAGLAHEIRNPLGGIQLYASLLQQDVADRPDSTLTCKKIINGVKRLEELVSQVLHFSREIVAHPADCDVAEIVREAIDLVALRITNGDVHFDVSIPDTLPRHGVDARLFSQATLNLVLNAVDAVGRDGTVSITLANVSDGRLSLAIEDTGPGIAPEILDRIFNPFFTTKDDGTGLGLSIVHRIVEAHNGSITASNRTDGGAKFEVRI